MVKKWVGMGGKGVGKEDVGGEGVGRSIGGVKREEYVGGEGVSRSMGGGCVGKEYVAIGGERVGTSTQNNDVTDCTPAKGDE